jgi:hypothetical protein
MKLFSNVAKIIIANFPSYHFLLIVTYKKAKLPA